MTLRLKLLLSVILVNVVIVGGLGGIVSDVVGRLQDTVNEQDRREQNAAFTAELPIAGWSEALAQSVLSEILDPSILSRVEDGLIVNSVFSSSLLDSGIEPYIFINAKGLKSRKGELDRDLAIERIKAANAERRVKDYEGGTWVAIPNSNEVVPDLAEAYAWYSICGVGQGILDSLRLQLQHEDRFAEARRRTVACRSDVSEAKYRIEEVIREVQEDGQRIPDMLAEARDVLAADTRPRQRRLDRVIEELTALARIGNEEADDRLVRTFQRAQEAFLVEDYDESRPLLLALAINGHATAQLYLGQMFERFSPAVSSSRWLGAYFKLKPPPPRSVEGKYLTTIWIIMPCGLLLLVWISYSLISKLFVHPLEQLVEGAKRVGQGNYDEPVHAHGGHDEVGTLVTAFNGMMESVGTYHHTLEARVQEATERMEVTQRHLVIAQRLAATGTLASGIAHEINNPLGGLINAARALRKRHDEDSFSVRYLDLIIEGLNRIGMTVRKVLSFTPREVEPQHSSVMDIVRRAHDLVSHRLSLEGVSFEVEGEDASVLVAPGEIQQVLLNLFINAADAMSEGGRIRVRVTRVEESVRIDVEDDGCGMDEADQAKAFDLFFTTKEVGEGTGLGLSIAHHIIINHGGTMEVRSKPEEGTTFVITLPIHRKAAS